MTRIKLKDRILPAYTKGEEIFNMTSHICRSSTWNCCNSFMRCYSCKASQCIWNCKSEQYLVLQ